MTTVVDTLPPEKRNDALAIEARVVAAYQAVFRGNGSKQDAEIVLTDLAMVSGYHDVMPENASDGAVHQHNGGRRVYSRIMFALNLPTERMNQLQEALLSTPVMTTEQE